MIPRFALLVLLSMGALPGIALGDASRDGPGQMAASTGAPPALPAQTLCILDFNRLGDDASMDWLQRGLADMMIGAMNGLGSHVVIERGQLRAILREQGLAQSGLVDMATAIRHARLVKAELLLLGSFARQQDRLTIQVRVIRIADQQILAQTVWTDQPENVLAAPRALTARLLAALGTPVDPAQLGGIEKEIPSTIDVAKSYYTGMGAFDDGRYPEALAHYLDAARNAGPFAKVHPAVLEMYALLGRSEHAVLFARRFAQVSEEAGDVSSALEYWFAAAQLFLDPLDDQRSAIEVLERLLYLATRHEQKTGEIAATKQFILARIDDLRGSGRYETFGAILSDRSIRHRIWPPDIESELRRRAEEHARRGHPLWHDGRWVRQSVPKPSVLMWKIRAHGALARAYARVGRIERALDQYQETLREVEFLTRHPLSDGGHRDAIRAEAHFMTLLHHAKTGLLIRDHALNAINSLNLVKNGFVFRRDFTHPDPDVRARVASRFPDRGYEYFDFAAPPGHQIVAVTLEARVEGIAAFDFALPRPAGWPPQFSFSRRLKAFKFSTRGTAERTVTLPPGVEFFSIGTSWGPGLFENSAAEVLQRRLLGHDAGKDIARWQVSFVVSPKAGVTATADRRAGTQSMNRYAAGWERAFVVREPRAVVHADKPSLDVYTEDWLVFAMDGDLQIFNRRDPEWRVAVPITINTKEIEFDPSLVRTHDGRYALLWARGTSKTTARRFVAFSADLRRWETPQRMVFAEPPGPIGYTYSQAEPTERTTNVVPIPGGYVMLLAQGFLRYSEDLRHWSAPRKVIPQDLYRNRLVKTADGTLWAVFENSSAERQPYAPDDDWLRGYFVIDGKPFRHMTELRVSRSMDGIRWHTVDTMVFPGQPSGLGAFPVSEGQIGIALPFNNFFVKWLTVSPSRKLRRIAPDLQTMHHSEEAECFVRDASLTCIRPVFDFEEQRPVLLGTSSKTLYGRFAE